MHITITTLDDAFLCLPVCRSVRPSVCLWIAVAGKEIANAEFRCADPMCLPAELQAFDVVVINDVIDKVSSPNSVLGRLGECERHWVTPVCVFLFPCRFYSTNFRSLKYLLFKCYRFNLILLISVGLSLGCFAVLSSCGARGDVSQAVCAAWCGLAAC